MLADLMPHPVVTLAGACLLVGAAFGVVWAVSAIRRWWTR